MSTADLREPWARADRSTPPEGVTQDPKFRPTRRLWVAVLLLAPLALVPMVWLGGDSSQVALKIRAADIQAVGAPEIPLHLNDRVEWWIEQFQTDRREEFEALMARRGLFEGLIRGKLRDRGMPEDLLYLAMIESGLSPFAESRVSAVGIWQFMGPTALELGLRVDEYVDERRDPVRATDAALDYLEWLRARFGSWYLAAAAYNAGPGRVERILNRHADGRTGDEDIYWEVLSHLPRETRDYVPRLVATTILANDVDATGFRVPDLPAYEYDMVFVPGGTTLDRVAESLDVDLGTVVDLNPHLTQRMTPPGELYGVRVPKGGIPVVMAMLGGGSMTRLAD